MGLSQRQAFIQAGYVVNDVADADTNASRLIRSAKVVTRLQEMEQAASYSAKVTVQTVTQMLVDVYHDGRKYKQVGAAATAAMGIAKLHGLLVDRIEDVTRKPARHPDAPLEIEVEHWLTDHGLLPAPAPDQSAPSEGQSVSASPGTEPVYQSPNAPLDSTLPGSQDDDSSHVNQGSGQGSGRAGEGSEPGAPEPQKPNENNGLTPPPGSNPEAGRPAVAEAPQKSGIFNLGDD